MSTTLVIGSSGTVGAELVRLLFAQGHKVRSVTSKPPVQADQVQLNLVTKQGLAKAFENVEQAFLMAPAGHTNQDELLNPLIDQARAQGLRKVILMTAMGANADEAAPMRKAERYLEGSGLAFNIIRPNWFMQNFHTYWIQGILQQGKINLPTGQAKASFIDTRDISAVAANLLFRNDLDGRDFDLTGSVAIDHKQVAAILSHETGRNINYQDIEPSAMLNGLLEAQLPRNFADFLILILGYLKAGYAERTTDAVKTITGNEPRSFEQYAKDYRSAWVV